MAEDLDKICVHYKASRNVEEGERKDSTYEQWGCYDCDGYKEKCKHNEPLGKIKFSIDD